LERGRLARFLAVRLLFQIFLIGSLAAVSLSACHQTVAPTNTDNTPDTSTYRPLATPATDFEQKLKLVRDGGFRYTWVFRKLDGKEFTHEDTEILHTQAPKVVDWIGTDDRKTFIAGSNAGIPPENELELKKRYKIEDMSGK
jgi:hypothetical protein